MADILVDILFLASVLDSNVVSKCTFIPVAPKPNFGNCYFRGMKEVLFQYFSKNKLSTMH